MVDGLLGLIAAERGGETVDRGLLSNLLRCFTSLGMYATAFQARPVSQVAPPGVPGGSSVAAPPPRWSTSSEAPPLCRRRVDAFCARACAEACRSAGCQRLCLVATTPGT